MVQDGRLEPLGWGPSAWERRFSDSTAGGDFWSITLALYMLDGPNAVSFIEAQTCVWRGQSSSTVRVDEMPGPVSGDGTKACRYRFDDGRRWFAYATGVRRVAVHLQVNLKSTLSDSEAIDFLSAMARKQLAVIERAYERRTPLHVIPTPTPSPTPTPTSTPTPRPTPTPTVAVPKVNPDPSIHQAYGIVRESDGTPISGVCVGIARSETNCHATTDVNGFYWLTWPATRTCSDILHLSKDGYQKAHRILYFPQPPPTPTPTGAAGEGGPRNVGCAGAPDWWALDPVVQVRTGWLTAPQLQFQGPTLQVDVVLTRTSPPQPQVCNQTTGYISVLATGYSIYLNGLYRGANNFASTVPAGSYVLVLDGPRGRFTYNNYLEPCKTWKVTRSDY